MNTDDGTSLDEQISSILAACDDALAAGASPTLTFSHEVPPEVKERIDRGLRSVTLLRRRLPSAGRFTLSPPPVPPGPPPADAPFSRLGRFLIRRELGRGAHGLVFLAHDPTLGRDVALKVPQAEALVSPDLRQRFVREARAAATLDHPNLVPVYEAGETGPVCYIASAYCPGPTLGQWLKDHDGPVPARVAAALLAGLASAAHHAHQRGVVHRDLKPGNVLLAPAGGPQEGGLGFVPKVTDFGLAKILAEGEASQTQTGTVMGSPSYMAPEQAGGKSLEAGAAADVYSLGAILYECLTGRPPFKAATVLATLDLVRSADPVPPRSLNPQVPTDLETVCLKCLHKEPSRRYASARDLEEDLGRFLAGKPVIARPVPAWEHVVRWARRRPGVAGLIGVLVVGAAVAFAVVFGLWRYAQAKATDEATARGEAEQGRRSVRAQLARADLKLGLSLCRQEDGAGLLWLARGLENAAAAEDPGLEALLRTQLAAWLPDVHTLRDSRRLPAPVRAVALTSDARLCLAGCEDGTAHLWESATGRAVGSPLTHPAAVEAVALSADGRWAATAADDGQVRIWDAAAGRLVSTARAWTVVPDVQPSAFSSLAFRPDGGAVLACWGPGGNVGVWEIPSGKQAGEFLWLSGLLLREYGNDRDNPAFVVARTHERHGTNILGLLAVVVSVIGSFSPDGARILTVTGPGGGQVEVAQLWEADGWRPVGPTVPRTPPTGAPPAGGFRADGTAVRASREGHGDSRTLLSFRDVATGKAVGPTLTLAFPVRKLVLAPDCRYSVAMGSAHAQLCDVDTGQPLGTALTHPGQVEAAACTGDGRTVLTGCQDGTVRLWRTDPAPRQFRTVRHPAGGDLEDVSFSPDGRTLLTRNSAGVHLWDATDFRAVGGLMAAGGSVFGATFSPDGGLVATSSEDKAVRFWRADTGERLGAALPHSGRVMGLAFRPHDNALVTWDIDGMARLWDVAAALDGGASPPRPMREFFLGATGQARCTPSADGRLLVSERDGILWDTSAAERRERLAPRGDMNAAFSPDGAALVGFVGEAGRVWEAASGTPLGPPLRHTDEVWHVWFHPRERLFLTTGRSRGAQVWVLDEASARPVRPPLRHEAVVYGAAFSPEGGLLATGGGDNTLCLWDLATSTLIGPPLRHPDEINRLAFRPDGRVIATRCRGPAVVHLWPVPSPLSGDPGLIIRAVEVRTGLKLGADETVRVLDPEEWRSLRAEDLPALVPAPGL